jgi:hypothetical protein
VLLLVGALSVPTNKEAQVNVPPPEIVEAVLKPDEEFKTTPFVTVKVKFELIVSVLADADVPRKVSDLQVTLSLTVTVIPELIMTSSVDVGMALPPQVAVSFQLPVTDAVLVAALALLILANKKTAKTIKNKRIALDRVLDNLEKFSGVE